MRVTAEMRWFWPNECPPDLKSWFFKPSPRAGGGLPRFDEYVQQSNASELGIKKRGSKAGIEVKGLIGTLSCPELMSLAPHCELWCKWTASDLLLNKTNSLMTKKVRWIRRLDTSGPAAYEVPVGPDEAPLNGRWLQEGCNLTLTKVQIVGVAGEWWTFCFEAFGDLESAPNNLQAATKHVRSMSFPQPNGAFLSYPAWLSKFESAARSSSISRVT
jgi:hypothetical protein